jgi:AcrR family transcriptional regulator
MPTDSTITSKDVRRQRVPAAERRDALVRAAVHEFARGGFHGTPVDRIARRVGVAQPYVFSLFGSKRELFLAAVERGFDQVVELFEQVAAEFDPASAPPDTDLRKAMGTAYAELLESERDYLMIQLQAYAACDDEVIRERVRSRYAQLVSRARELTGAEPDELDDFFRHGMAVNVAAAMGVEDLSVNCEWIRAELEEASQSAERPSG